jgi:hypothetical protein
MATSLMTTSLVNTRLMSQSNDATVSSRCSSSCEERHSQTSRSTQSGHAIPGPAADARGGLERPAPSPLDLLARGVMAPRTGVDPRTAQNMAMWQAQLLQQQKQAAVHAAQDAKARAHADVSGDRGPRRRRCVGSAFRTSLALEPGVAVEKFDSGAGDGLRDYAEPQCADGAVDSRCSAMPTMVRVAATVRAMTGSAAPSARRPSPRGWERSQLTTSAVQEDGTCSCHGGNGVVVGHYRNHLLTLRSATTITLPLAPQGPRSPPPLVSPPTM